MHWLSRALCKPNSGQFFAVNGEDHILQGKLGDGAAGLVRKAIRKHDHASLAVKFLAPDPKYIDVDKFDDVAARFRREGLRGPDLKHASLIQIDAYCQNDDGAAFDRREPKNPFLLMERIHGRPLESHIVRERSEPHARFQATRPRMAIAIQVSSALAYLHQSKLIHRDVKPANIFLSNPFVEIPLCRAKLGDFGVVKWGDFHASVSTGSLTLTSQKGLGTMKYMSPEQAVSPKEVGVRSDVFSLGVTLLELFTGQILASPHHVFQLMTARRARGTTQSRFESVGISVAGDDADIAALVLDMFASSDRERPSSAKIYARLQYEYERHYDVDWVTDFMAIERADAHAADARRPKGS
jgi:serine/threonine protein kinase